MSLIDKDLRKELIGASNRVFEIRNFDLNKLCLEAETLDQTLRKTLDYGQTKDELQNILVDIDNNSSSATDFFVKTQGRIQRIICDEIHKIDLELLRN